MTQTKPGQPVMDRRAQMERGARSASGRGTNQPHAEPSPPTSSVFRQALRERLPAWVLAPLRLFLGVTFIYAGLQKLTDPQFFNSKAPGYIGKQIQGFASGSPIHGLLLDVALPHASFYGGLIAWGELAIGIGALVGLLLRPAAFFGALLSLIFFLSASWRVHPYFYGADIVFLFAWVTLLLAGPLAGGWPALDPWLARWLGARLAAANESTVAAALALVLGAQSGASLEQDRAPDETGAQPAKQRNTAKLQAQRRYSRAIGRRDFLRGAVTGGGVMLVAAWLWSLTHPATQSGAALAPAGSSGSATTAGSASTGAPSASNQIALVKDVPANSAATFTIPSTGDPGVLVHLSSGKFVAYDAVCTHAGCTVQYDGQSQLLLCPCHGAAFNPAQQAAVVQGPAPTPLSPVSVTVDQSTGAITLN